MSAKMFKGLPINKLSKQMARLNLIAGTPQNAYKLDPQFKKVELILLHKNIFGPSLGMKKFWRHNLPVLKFHNDDVDFVLTRVRASTKAEIAQVPTKIILHDAQGQKTEFDCANAHSNEILERLVKATKAKPVPSSEIPEFTR